MFFARVAGVAPLQGTARWPGELLRMRTRGPPAGFGAGESVTSPSFRPGSRARENSNFEILARGG